MPFDPHDIFFDDFKRYWPVGVESIRVLPLQRVVLPAHEPLPPVLTLIRLPEWAVDLGVDGHILVPTHLLPGENKWEAADWPLTALWYVHGLAERAFESRYKPIHSYSSRLKGWDDRLWRHAWANRIALFLRRWAAHRSGLAEQDLFGPLPEPAIIFTHDVDAIGKTLPVRIKHTAFMVHNALKQSKYNSFSFLAISLFAALKYLVRHDDYWSFDRIQELESRYGVTSWFFFYGGPGGMWRMPQDILFDPGYVVNGRRIARQIVLLRDSGHPIGLHQAFGSWHDHQRMVKEKRSLENVVKETVSACRQHWLRFSWCKTWVAQDNSGLELDCTLGFNDRPGFRNSAALRHKPLASNLGSRLGIESLPVVIMDSHFYSNPFHRGNDIGQRLRQWIDEILTVRGQATVIWHQHTFSRDYGWQHGYETLLKLLFRDIPCQNS
jgi:hypothetical protein